MKGQGVGVRSGFKILDFGFGIRGRGDRDQGASQKSERRESRGDGRLGSGREASGTFSFSSEMQNARVRRRMRF